MTRLEIKNFLKEYDMTYSKLATEAGIGRYSLYRYLQNNKVGISTLTVQKIEAAMHRIVRKSQK